MWHGDLAASGVGVAGRVNDVRYLVLDVTTCETCPARVVVFVIGLTVLVTQPSVPASVRTVQSSG